MPCRLSVVRTKDHVSGVESALKLVAEDFPKGLKKVLIKPNFVSTRVKLSATPVETVRGVLRFVNEFYSPSEVLIAESPAMGRFEDALSNFGYYDLRSDFPGLEFVDLDSLEAKSVTLSDQHGGSFEVPIPSVMFDKSVLKISPVRPKTHDTVIVTLTVKNLVMGSIRRGHKSSMHRGYLTINRNIAKLFSTMGPCCGVVDGIEGMEGDGPVSGSAKRWGYVFASCNCAALDRAVASAMGFNPDDVGYLYLLKDLAGQVITVGEPLPQASTKFTPHRSYIDQMSWKDEIAADGKA
ncbi:DUF362 domain-containing protein [Tardisphaera miroshnichenkoae]